MRQITKEYLQEHPNEIFVFGDNLKRFGKGGAAALRGEPNTYGFITKKFPSYDPRSYYTVEEYKPVFERELAELIKEIEMHPDKKYLISPLGSNLANRYGIWEGVIRDGLKVLSQYRNVEFLF